MARALSTAPIVLLNNQVRKSLFIGALLARTGRPRIRTLLPLNSHASHAPPARARLGGGAARVPPPQCAGTARQAPEVLHYKRSKQPHDVTMI